MSRRFTYFNDTTQQIVFEIIGPDSWHQEDADKEYVRARGQRPFQVPHIQCKIRVIERDTYDRKRRHKAR